MNGYTQLIILEIGINADTVDEAVIKSTERAKDVKRILGKKFPTRIVRTAITPDDREESLSLLGELRHMLEGLRDIDLMNAAVKAGSDAGAGYAIGYRSAVQEILEAIDKIEEVNN